MRLAFLVHLATFRVDDSRGYVILFQIHSVHNFCQAKAINLSRCMIRLFDEKDTDSCLDPRRFFSLKLYPM